jgi:hypothetical protein
MSIDKEVAIDVAKRHGLSLGDAAGIARLADTPEEADRIARHYAAPRRMSREDLASMTPAEINKAREEGQLDALLSGKEGGGD